MYDNFFTGRKSNLAAWLDHPRFELIRGDVIEPLMVEVDQIYHLACPASPVHYQYDPIWTMKTSVLGTMNMLGLAKRTKARILLSSTSEVYGDPEVHPQPETYWGNVNCAGPRSCYDEGKRVAETLMWDYHRQHGVDIRVARIFNTYGPRMLPNDGRVVSNFAVQALRSEDLTLYGDGLQTRSFCFVADLVRGLIKLMNGNDLGPINLGNPTEFTIKELAELTIAYVNPSLKVVYKEPVADDPKRRKPIIEKAKAKLDWEPRIRLQEGLKETIDFFREDMRLREEEKALCDKVETEYLKSGKI